MSLQIINEPILLPFTNNNFFKINYLDFEYKLSDDSRL